MRITSDEPHYWKAVNLSTFDGTGWNEEAPDRGGGDFEDELRADWRNKPGWQDRIEVSVRRMRTLDVPAPGTIMEIENATRPLRPSGVPGRWTATSELRRGDSYTAEVYDPEPTAGEVRQADRTGLRVARGDQLEITLPFLVRRQPTIRSVGGVTDGRIDSAVVHFRPFGDEDVGYVTYPQVRRTRYDAIDSSFRRSAVRAHVGAGQVSSAPRAETPFEYILLVNNYLRGGEFGYSERPQPPAAGRAPLDAFLIDTKEGYCQHFSGRDGAAAADGRDPGAGGDRASAPAASRSAATPGSCATPTPTRGSRRGTTSSAGSPTTRRPTRPRALADRRARGGAGRRSRPRRPTTDRGGRRRRRRAAVRACSGPTSSSTRCATAPARRPTSRARASPGGSWALVASRVVLVALRPGPLAPRPPPPRHACRRSTARSPSSRPRCAAPAGRCSTGTTLRQLEQRLGASPDATAYLRALSASRYGPAPTPPTAAQRKALRRALAQGLGPGGSAARVLGVAAAAAVSAGERQPRH